MQLGVACGRGGGMLHNSPKGEHTFSPSQNRNDVSQQSAQSVHNLCHMHSVLLSIKKTQTLEISIWHLLVHEAQTLCPRTGVPVYRYAAVPVYQCIGLPVYLCTSVLAYRCLCVPVCRCTCVLVHWCNGEAMCPCTSVPVYRCAVVPVYRCTDIPV